MIRISVYQLEVFLQVVNGCIGPVNVIYPDGRKEDINKQYRRQKELLYSHRQNNNCLKLSLEIPAVKDYFDIVYFTIGDC